MLLLCCGSAVAEVIGAKWKEPGRRIALTLPAEAAGGTVGVWWSDDTGLLRAVHTAAAKDVIDLPTDGRWAALSGGRLEVFVYGRPGSATLPVDARPGAEAPGRPMSHGVFTEAAQPPRRWHVDDQHTLIWDGAAWIPFGGMFCSPVLSFYDRNQTPIEQRWSAHAQALDQIQAAGFNDLYINLAHGPVEVSQQVIDDLNRRGMHFGWQLRGGSTGPIQGYLVRKTATQGLLVGVCDQPGRLQVRLPKEKILGLLIVGFEDGSVRNIDQSVNLAEPHAHPGFIQIDHVTEAGAKVVDVTLTVESLPAGKYYVLTRAAVNGHASNIWGNVDAIVQKHAWVRQIKWGAGLRFFVDPILNEEGLYNQTESVRAWTPAFNADYAAWLKRRYQTVPALLGAWHLPAGAADSFEVAARLVPLRDADAAWAGQTVRWIDPVSLRQVATVGGVGQGWLDYVQAVRDTYAESRDAVARGVKQLVDVPVVFKRVSPWVNAEAINRRPGGIDGVGLELYPGKGSMINQGLCAGAVEAELAAQTSWIIATEIGYSPATHNGGVRGFPSRQYVNDLLGTAAAFGARGFMLFGWRLEPYDLWTSMQLHDQPEQLAWIAETRQKMLGDWPRRWPMAQAYPEGENWWWKAGGQSLSRYRALLDKPVSLIRQSVMLDPNAQGGPLWAVSSTPVLPHAVLRLVNFASPESAQRYGPTVAEWLKDGEKVVYVGLLPEGARAPWLAEHFTGERFKIDDDEAQALRVNPGDQTLAAHDGKPWAKRSGNLLIVARWSPSRKSNSDAPLAGLDPRWVRGLLSAPAPAAP